MNPWPHARRRALLPAQRWKKPPPFLLAVLGSLVAVSLPAGEPSAAGPGAAIPPGAPVPAAGPPPVPDWFALPVANIADVLSSAPTATAGPVRIEGLVERKAGEFLFVVSDKTGRIPVQASNTDRLRLKQVIDVVGLRKPLEPAPVLTAVAIRRIGNVDLPVPASSAPGSPPPAPITTAQEIRALTPEAAALARPVRLQCVVTYYDPGEAIVFVQDATAGIYVEAADLPLDITSGQKVDLEGLTQPGGFAPVIVNPVFHILGQAPLPAPAPYSLEELFAGNQDSQWIEMRGIVRSARPVDRQLEMNVVIDRGKQVIVTIPLSANRLASTDLVGARVTLRGVSGTVFNQKRQFVGLRLFLPDPSFITVEQGVAVDGFTLPVRPISSLLQFKAAEGAESRVRVQGVVTYTRPGAFFFVQDESGGLLVKADLTDQRAVGDRMDVVGFPEAGGYTPILAQAVFRKTGTGPQPGPLVLAGANVAETIYNIQEDTSDAKLIRFRCRLLEQTATVNDKMLVLQQGSTIFTAYLAETSAFKSWSVLQTGSLLEITGVCSIQVDANNAPVSFRLYLRSPADVVLLERPPWWTVQHTLGVVMAMLAIAVLAFGWIFALRRRVKTQTQLIQQRLEREKALEARYRELFASNPHPMWVLDLATLGFLEVNAAAASHYGYSPEEFRGMTLRDVCPVTGPGAGGTNPVAQRPGEIIKGLRATHRKRDGTLIEVEVSSHQLWFADRKANLILINDITERLKADAELAEVHRQLLATSRQAGMAEVATGVLHNVGNVLNSVNVSATLVIDRVRQSKTANLPKLGALLQAHAGDLADFLTHDAKGRSIPAYLQTLAGQIAAEQSSMVEELEHLRKNIEHIKDIVAMQQSFGHVSGVRETVALTDLLEDALRMNASALVRHGIEVVRDYRARLTVTTDRHKVMQILVNLIRNAKLACHESGRTARQITVRTTGDDRGVRIAIVDNGIGIPAENLVRIFNHGFTTRKNGHGFGLHSGALAARELGGALTVQSDGPGLGATFVLELPGPTA